MNAHAQAPGIHTTCPYCGVGCGVVATPDGAGGAAISGDKSHPANFGDLCSKGSALGETLGLETRLLHPMGDGARDMGHRPRPHCRRIAADHRKAWSGRRRVLSFGPIAHRGLLRRQQADERLYRRRQCRHKFAPLHGLLGRRTQAGLRVGYGARLLRRPRRGGPPGARWIECGLVPSGALSTDGVSAARETRRAHRYHRCPRHGDDRKCRSRAND
jgi:hypothetical protein